MSEAGLMSPNNDILTTPKESLKTPKFREFNEMTGGLVALRSPRDFRDFDSLNTPLPLTTPVPHGEGLLSTPTLTTPRTADWGLFSPMNLGSNCSSPRESSQRDNRPADLPLDSTIGLSSPHDGVLAKRRKLKNLNSSHSRSIESDSNSCDTPTTETDFPRDLSKKGDRSRIGSDSSPQAEDLASPTNHVSDLDRVRDKVGAVAISTSPRWFKHPKHLPESLKLTKELLSDMPSSYHPSPLAVPSPNWTAISAFMTSEGLALKTPKVLDNFVFDVLPPNTPSTPKVNRERSPESSQPLNYEKHKFQEDMRIKQRTEGRVTFADQPRPQSLTPPPPYPEDLSMRHKSIDDVVPKQEYHDPYHQHNNRLSPPSPPTHLEDQVKEEPREYPNIPPGFPPYYLHPGITPQQIYSRQSERPASPPASPPRAITNSNPYQPRQQFYAGLQRHPGLNLSSLYDGHNPPYNMWGGGHHHSDMHGHGPHVTMPTPPQNIWNRTHPEHLNQGMQNYVNLKPSLKELSVKSETRLSTDSQDSLKKKCRKMRQDEMDPNDHDPNQEGQPPKKRGKGKGKAANSNNNKDPNGPKRVFVCPHCQRSYDWNYNLNRHLKYECGKENAFMCSKCGRRFPHKQNCVYHLKRKHKIICETIDQYVSAGLVVFQGNPQAGLSAATGHPSPSGSCYSPGMKETSVTPPPSQNTV